MVDADVPHPTQKGEVDDSCGVLLVVGHQLVEAVVLLAGEGEHAVGFLDELRHLMQACGREAATRGREIELTDETPSNGIAVQHGAVLLQCQALEGMACSVAEIESLANAMLVGVFGDDALFDSHALGYHRLQMFQVGVEDVKGEEFDKHRLIRDQTMLEHLGITAADVLHIEGLQELGVQDDRGGGVEDANLVLQPTEIDACLPAYTGIDHRQQCGRNVNIGYATLEGGGCEAAEVRDHSAAKVDEHGMACGTALAQCCPHLSQRVEGLGLVAGTYGDDIERLILRGTQSIPQHRQAKVARVDICEHEEAVGLHTVNGCSELCRKIATNDDLLFHRRCILYFDAAKIIQVLRSTKYVLLKNIKAVLRSPKHRSIMTM